MRYFFSILLIVFLSVTTVLHAQSPAPSFYLSVHPSNPLPGQIVTISAHSTEMNLDQTPIIWKANGQTLESRGQSISIAAPQAGNTGTITATVASSGINTATATTILRTAMIDLIWEATDSYTPPFYKGKALPATNSTLQVVAIPALNAPKSMTYTWSKEGIVLGSLSGLNRSVYSFKNNELNTTESVSVTGSSGNFTSSVSKVIQIEQPEIVVYKKQGGFIDYANGSNISLSTTLSGIILRLEPFFFSTTNNNPKTLSFNITHDGGTITNNEKANELSLSNSARETGYTALQIETFSPKSIFQTIKKVFTVNFD